MILSVFNICSAVSSVFTADIFIRQNGKITGVTHESHGGFLQLGLSCKFAVQQQGHENLKPKHNAADIYISTPVVDKSKCFENSM